MSTYTDERHMGFRDRFASGWGPVLSGAAAAFLTFITFSALWLAVAASGAEWVANNLSWFEFATALFAATIGGLATGWLQPGSRAAGMTRGFASWGLVLVVGLIVGVPATLGVFSAVSNAAIQTGAQGGTLAGQLGGLTAELWSAFAIFGGGGILAALAGATSATSMTGERDTEVTTTRRTEDVAPRDVERERERDLVTSERR